MLASCCTLCSIPGPVPSSIPSGLPLSVQACNLHGRGLCMTTPTLSTLANLFPGPKPRPFPTKRPSSPCHAHSTLAPINGLDLGQVPPLSSRRPRPGCALDTPMPRPGGPDPRHHWPLWREAPPHPQTPPPAPPWPPLDLPCWSLGRDALGSFGLVPTGPLAPLQVALLQLMGSPELAREEDAQQKQQLKTK